MKKSVSLASEYPELIKEWHPTKNGLLSPENVAPKSSKKVWWIGACGHEWESAVSSRTSGHGCPFCSGNRVLSGFNDLSTKNPLLASEWHPTKNGDLKPSLVTSTAHMKVWWLGKCGHEWEATVNYRSKGVGCPICSNSKILVGYNDFATTQKELLKEWHSTKNGNIRPEEVTAASGIKIWWKGKCGHEWNAAINSRVNGRGCPVCAGRQVLVGYNDLKSVNPVLAKEWNHEKNGSLTPEMIIAGSEKKVWWICEKGHEWLAAVKDRNRGRGCPICAGKAVQIGVNDLATTKPELAKEWNYSKNGTLKPDSFTSKSGKKVWWVCEKGHEWEATIASRADGRGCPICNKEKQTSFPEQAIFYYISRLFPDALNGDIGAIGIELDIYIPSINCAIEYDGYRWHQNKENDKTKNDLCAEKGIKLIRIREEGLPFYDNCICIRRENRKNIDSLNDVIKAIIKTLGSNYLGSIDVSKDESSILDSYIFQEKEKSLGALFPEVAKEWHPTKNGLLTPYSFSYGSKKRMWWLGKCGHEWQASIGERTVRGYGCPICSGRQVYSGINDLETFNGDIAREWDNEKNGDITPNQVTIGSSKKVWWKCQYGHEWLSSVISRVQGHGCPICARQRSLSKVKEIEQNIIDIKTEWDAEKNGPYDTTILSVALSKKLWWKCQHGHEWSATIKSRLNWSGCPYCSTNAVQAGYNDLASLYPDLALEWHPTKNNGLLPSGITAGSSRLVWWLGKCGHEWRSTVLNRRNGSGCPYCSGSKVLQGFNDLSTINPELAAEWDYSANSGLL
ncbi:MAG: zinc-ribbon domain-containing protein, partial [Lachnospiraceae bacterium]|nr:zinc-ribbon domain-containing protein [Lachnospiraceae bacterium]